ncbi:OadG-related small transporter subunit [Fusibacter bizertensis]|jgi:Oxaloacetate decarboxylase, gamma chain.|uniref:OadG-related small transporter subunit n=1 Tax=Fusibacter bizertensis TaxID=1488331 RepID=A0ABT6NBI1_9FIRM|nr:OadG-related small transporter subunit [Fusibacter bizertensis]MDH8677780.1 OadG-related small transporter subunit [Fusibacter bizertensis]
MNELELGLELMGYGLAGVFIVLILFFIVIKILVKIFPSRE